MTLRFRVFIRAKFGKVIYSQKSKRSLPFWGIFLLESKRARGAKAVKGGEAITVGDAKRSGAPLRARATVLEYNTGKSLW